MVYFPQAGEILWDRRLFTYIHLDKLHYLEELSKHFFPLFSGSVKFFFFFSKTGVKPDLAVWQLSRRVKRSNSHKTPPTLAL